MAIRVVADTHAILWYLYNDSRLSPTASGLMDNIDGARDQIAIASITLAEIIYLFAHMGGALKLHDPYSEKEGNFSRIPIWAYLLEKGRIDPHAFERVVRVMKQADATLVEIPFDHQVAEAMLQVPRTQVPELPDRIVTATALHPGVPVISRDHKIHSSDVTTIW